MNDHLFIGAVNVILIPQLVVESVLNLDISQVKIFFLKDTAWISEWLNIFWFCTKLLLQNSKDYNLD